MTSTPVKDVNPLMNFVGGKNFGRTGKTGQSGSFGDVMNMAKSFGQGNQGSMTASQVNKTPATETSKSRTDTVKPEKAAEETKKPQTGPDDHAEALEKAGKEMVREIAEEMGVTEEEVEKAMEALGLSVFSLFDPANLTQLALMLGGEQDAAALLTDENLFASLQNLLKMAEDMKAGLMQEMNLTPDDLKALLANIQNAGSQKEGLIQASGEGEEEPQITVEVKAGDQTVKLAADENGNAIKTVEVVPSNAKENVSDENSNRHEQKDGEGKGQSEGELHGGNPLIDSLMENKPQSAEVTFEQMTPMFSEQTRDIMDQIMDYMKIQLKPGMDQLEMQLHPESLGTVHIQLISKGGEVTAHFQVQNEAVKAALESQISTLQETLKEQGVKVEAVQVTVENHG